MAKVKYAKRWAVQKKHITITVPIDLLELIEKFKVLFGSRSEFIRFCVVNTLINLDKREFIVKNQLRDMRRFFRINDKKVEIDGVLYSVVEE